MYTCGEKRSGPDGQGVVEERGLTAFFLSFFTSHTPCSRASGERLFCTWSVGLVVCWCVGLHGRPIYADLLVYWSTGLTVYRPTSLQVWWPTYLPTGLPTW